MKTMNNPTKSKPPPNQEMVLAVFSELMNQIRKQEDMVNSWIKYYISIQAGLAFAVAYFVRLNPTEGSLSNVGSLFISFLGIATAVCMTNIIHREQKWEGRYITQVNDLPQLPKVFKNKWVPDPAKPKGKGKIAKQISWLRNFNILGWVIMMVVILCNMQG